jgi:hypothetical protein
MVIPWLNSIRQTHKLTIFAAQNAAALAPILGVAVTRFNALSQSLSLNVTYEIGSTAPDPDNLNGANVQFALANGAYSFKGLGADGNGFLAANAREGVTRFVTGGNDKDAKLAKAFIFLPASIQVHDFMKTCMTVHEMVHATGLDNDEHSSDADPDIFCSSLTPSGSGVQCGLFANRIMPPIWMTLRTAAKIQAPWS